MAMVQTLERTADATRRDASLNEAPTPSLIDAIHDTLRDEMRADDRIVLLGEDVGQRGGVFRVTAGLLEEFGEGRVIDMPLAESLIIGSAIGMAVNGVRPDRKSVVWGSGEEVV